MAEAFSLKDELFNARTLDILAAEFAAGVPGFDGPRFAAAALSRFDELGLLERLEWMADCLEAPATAGRAFDIGGPDVLTYRALMDHMVSALGLPRRLVIPVPVLTPRLSSLWIAATP